MPYLIDGHNLIPKIPGINLEASDDEAELVKLLLEYCRLSRKKVQVFFDKASPGGRGARNHGAVVAHFIPENDSADQAIRRKLARLGSEARNWTVVSSDHSVQAAAHAARARSISSEAFARQLEEVLAGRSPGPGERDAISLSPDQVEGWYQEFTRAKPEK